MRNRFQQVKLTAPVRISNKVEQRGRRTHYFISSPRLSSNKDVSLMEGDVVLTRNISRKISKDHYAVLNIHSKASKEEIRTAYLELSKKLHPDKNLTIKDTHSRFLEIQEAYNILSNEESRKIYDSSFKSKDAIFDEEQMDKEMTTTMNQDEQRMYSEWRGSKSSRRSRSKQHFRVEMEGSTSQPHQFVLQITVFMVFIIASISFANRVLDYRRDDNLAQILKDGFKK